MSYSEKDDLVVLTLSREDFQQLRLLLWFGDSLRFNDVPLAGFREFCNRLNEGNPGFREFCNRLNEGNPDYKPYTVTGGTQ